jgi:hypothetical protein
MTTSEDDLIKALFGDQPFTHVKMEVPDIDESIGERTTWMHADTFMVVEGGAVGVLDRIFRNGDPRPAKEQIEDRYYHGGGYRPIPGFRLERGSIVYPGDPENGEDDEVYEPIAFTALNSTELIVLYQSGFVRVSQTNGDFDIVRMD